MSKLLVSIVLGLMALAPAVTAANEIRVLSSHPSSSELQASCDASGGQFSIDEGLDSYTCLKENCDGEGGHCYVNCDPTECIGSTPDRIVGCATLVGILQNGDMLRHDPAAPSLDSLFTSSEGTVIRKR